MGTASTTKFIKNNAGTLTEQAALTSSAGAGDAHALVALNRGHPGPHDHQQQNHQCGRWRFWQGRGSGRCWSYQLDHDAGRSWC